MCRKAPGALQRAGQKCAATCPPAVVTELSARQPTRQAPTARPTSRSSRSSAMADGWPAMSNACQHRFAVPSSTGIARPAAGDGDRLPGAVIAATGVKAICLARETPTDKILGTASHRHTLDAKPSPERSADFTAFSRQATTRPIDLIEAPSGQPMGSALPTKYAAWWPMPLGAQELSIQNNAVEENRRI